MIRKAMEIARKAHAGQVDKGGTPYINHPIAVSKKVLEEDAKIVALLHDVVEDTDITLDDLKAEGFPEHILKAIDAITRRPCEMVHEYIARVKANSLACEVKKADLTHNMDISRIPTPTASDRTRIDLYRWLYNFLDS